MTDAPNSNHHLLTSATEAATLYHPAPNAGQIGVEHEMHVYQRLPDDGIALVGADAMQRLRQNLESRGYTPHLEPSSILEYAGPAMPLTELPKLFRKTAEDVTNFKKAIHDAGLGYAPFAVMPSTTITDALNAMNSHPRLRTGIEAVRQVGKHGALAIPLLTTGTQVSFSPNSTDEMFRMMRRAYALTPLLLAMANSDCGFAENNSTRRNHHLRGAYYRDYGAAGGISKAFLTAEDGASLLTNHCREVFDALMYCAYDADGKLMGSTRDRPLRFAQLPPALQTVSNYRMAQTFLYHDVKICNIYDAAQEVVGMRLEVRGADSGPHQHLTVPLLLAALIPDGPTADAFEKTLADFGFTGHPGQDADLLRQGRDAAVYHNGAFMDVSFGRDKAGTPRRLLELGQEVAKILHTHPPYQALDSFTRMHLDLLRDILEQGTNTSALQATQINSQEDAQNFLHEQGPSPRLPQNTRRVATPGL